MKTDKQGRSTCPKGQEQYEDFYSFATDKTLVQYDYRHNTGELFTCIAPTLEAARAKRDQWLERKRKVWAGCCEDPNKVDPYNRL